MSFYIKRRTSYGWGWTGPTRSPRQAEKERQAWEDSGRPAEVLPSTPEVRAQVRQWERERDLRVSQVGVLAGRS